MSEPCVLVVDDDEDFAEMLALTLQFRGCRVERAHSGEAAVKMFAANDYDLAFMDVKLPDIDGVESFIEIRRARPDAKVVLITGYSRDSVLHRAVREGVLGVVQKPPSADELMEFVALATASG